MPTAPALNPAAILAKLGLTNPTVHTPVHGGADTVLWRVEAGPETYALRVLRAEQAAVSVRERQAMVAARQAGLRVPEVYAHTTWQGRPILLLSWQPGVPLWEALQRRPWRAWTLGKAFGRAQARLHQVLPPASWHGRAHDWITAAGDRGLQATLQAIASEEPALLHLDYHPLNVLTDGRQITGIVDWTNAQAGDPRADFARTYTILVVEPLGPGRQPPRVSLLRRLLALSWRRGYRQVSGPLHEMVPFYAWAGDFMARDLAPRVVDADSWWRPQDLAHIVRWTKKWRER